MQYTSRTDYFSRNRYTTSGTQMRKLAKPMIKKVGIKRLICDSPAPKNQILVSAVVAHSSIAAQKIRKEIFSIILLVTICLEEKVQRPETSFPAAVPFVSTGGFESYRFGTGCRYFVRSLQNSWQPFQILTSCLPDSFPSTQNRPKCGYLCRREDLNLRPQLYECCALTN